MNFTFENQGTSTYLVYTVSPEDTLDTMSLGMLTNNHIPGLAATLFTQMDATKYIKYNVSAKISVKQFFSGQVNKKRLIGVFRGIVDAMLSAEDYMIDESTILLDMEYIFADVSSCETVLICLPLMQREEQGVDLGSFFKRIMFSTQFDQTENCDHVAKLINYLNSAPVFSLTEFQAVLEQIDAQPAAAASRPQKVAPQPTASQSMGASTPAPPSAAPQPTVPQPMASQKAAPQPIVPPPSPSAPQTTVISQAQPPKPSPAPNDPKQKKMTMLGLLTHYSKENAAIYKAQQQEKKQQKSAAKQASAGFQVPGTAPAPQSAPMPQKPGTAPAAGFAVPGQAPQGFAVPGQQPAPIQPAAPRPQPSAPPVPAAAPAPAPQPTPPPAMPQGHAMSFGETTVLGGARGGETTVLGASMASSSPKPYLIRVKNQEKVPLDKPVFRIGKEKSYVDYFIGDNSAISRSHANIITRDGAYFVVDTNSTNHTYINGTMIPSNVETAISTGTRIKLGNEEFEFKLL